MKLCLALLITLATTAIARTWTNDQGKTIEAEIVRVDAGEPIVKKAGQEMRLTLAKLSPADQEYVKKWVDQQTAKSLLLDGKPLEKGGKINLVERPYSARMLQQLKEDKHEAETSIKIALAVPAAFDPSQPQHVFIVSTAVNNEAERVAGNISKMNMYLKTCMELGWVCLAIDSNTGYPSTYGGMLEGMEFLTKAWPKFQTNDYAVGGFSGGAKSCHGNAAWLLSHKYRVCGIFMGGCNQDFSALHKAQFKLTTSDYHGLRAFVSTGRKDNLVPPEATEKVLKSLGETGIDQVRSELHEGGHSFHQPHFADALKWFVEAGKKQP
jgi:hypothetical protein